MSMITDICSMHILLVAATRLEIQPTIDFLEKTGYSIGSHHVEVLVSGVGGLAIAWSLKDRIGVKRPGIAIQAGIAGAFPAKMEGSLLAIKSETLADLGVWEEGRFKSLFDMELAGRNDPPFTEGRLVNPFDAYLSSSGLEQVSSISVNEITTLPSRIAWYQQNWVPVVESMEGGAFHYVCLREGIPFLQIRSVSNQVGERDKTKWDIRSAIKNLNERLAIILEQL